MNDIVGETKEQMEKAIAHLRQKLAELRTNRPNPSMLDNISVSAYGTEMKLKELASVSSAEGRQLLVSPFDHHLTSTVAKAIERANLSVQVVVDGHLVRVILPEMSEELRKEVLKSAKEEVEKAKVAIRESRRKAKGLLKKQRAQEEVSEDEQKRLEEKVQQKTDHFCRVADEVFKEKEVDILSI